jgi:hypothetical protein
LGFDSKACGITVSTKKHLRLICAYCRYGTRFFFRLLVLRSGSTVLEASSRSACTGHADRGRSDERRDISIDRSLAAWRREERPFHRAFVQRRACVAAKSR